MTCTACAGPERPLLDEFFSASRLRDRTALRSIATTVFEPREQGIVRRFDIVSVVAQPGGAREDVTIAASVAMPDGRTVQKTLEVALERNAAGRWIVTGVADRGRRP